MHPTFRKLRLELEHMSKSANIRCKDFCTVLRKLGFIVHDGASGGHKIVEHRYFLLLPQDAANFNCGHRDGQAVKSPYIKKFLRLVDRYQEQIEDYLK